MPKPVLRVLSGIYPGLSPKVRISTKALKHIYDDHAPHSIEIIKTLAAVIGSPDAIYENKPEREGTYIFSLGYKRRTYCAVLDVMDAESGYVLRYVQPSTHQIPRDTSGV